MRQTRMQQTAICCSFRGTSEVVEISCACDLGLRVRFPHDTWAELEKLQHIAVCCIKDGGRGRKSLRMFDMRTGAGDVAANFGRRTQAAGHIDSRGLLYGIRYLASVAEQEPIFIQVSSLHTQ